MNDKPVETLHGSAQLVLLDQQLALGAYLQALLRPAPPEPTEQPAAEPIPAATHEATHEVVPESHVESRVEPEVEPTTRSLPQQGGAAYPDWAQGQFQCLMFRVAGLTLALPLNKLNGVLPWDADLVSEMPNHRPWFLGLRTHLDHKVKLIDVAKVVLPEDRRAGLPPIDSGRLGKIILIDSGRWGLVCEDVAEVVTLSGSDVKWRSQVGSRPWLAGTVIEQMCALIDSDAFAEMLRGSGPNAA